MKKILLMCFMLVIAFVMAGCNNENKTYDESKYSNLLNQSIEESFEFNNEKEEELAAPISFEEFLNIYNKKNKFLVSIKKENDNVICGYLDNSIKEKLETVDITEPDGNPGWYIWVGVNNYIKKYEYAVNNNIIQAKDYSIKWFEIDNKELIAENYNELFLICMTTCYNLTFVNYDTNEVYERKIYVDDNSILNDIIEKEKKYIVLYEMISEKLSAIDLYELTQLDSFDYMLLENEIYVNSRYKEKNDKLNLKDYKVIDNKFYYNLKEIKEIMEGNI